MTHGKLYRSFIILQEDERGYSSSSEKALSGYAKIEVKNEKCKITFYVQNVKKDNNKCYMMLVCNKKDMKQLINLGAMNINEQGKSEVTCEFSVSDIAGLGISYDKICGAALYKQIDGKNIFLMAGFTTGEIPKDNWKMYKMVNSKMSTAIENKKTESKNKVDVKIKEDVEIKKSKSEHNTKIEKELEMKIEEQEYYNTKKKREEDEVYNSEGIYNNSVEETKYFEEEKEIERNRFDEYEKEIEEINKSNERLEQEEEIQLRGSVGEFFEGIAEGFENVRSKFKDVKYCKWYNVPIDNLDVMCNVSNYNKYTTVYYPMVNYYPYIKKYGHFMIGFKCNEEGKVNYLVYAVPGLKDKSEQPYGGKSGFVTWVEDSQKGKDMGYWLMFYDFKNSMVVVPMK